MASKRKTPTAAAIYARISLDRDDDGIGVDRQIDLCRELAKEKGWRVAGVYPDNNVSASNGKTREHYERMLADIETGRIDAVVCVDLDRLTRRPIELEHFIDLADRHDVALANVSGDTDLSSSDGRLKARIMGAVARQEGEKKGERLQREHEQAARKGKGRWARRAFGYEAVPALNEDGSPKLTKNGKVLLERVVVPAEAAAIRDAADRILAGESLPAIARLWNDQGLAPPQGAQHGWSANTVGIVLRNPRLAGIRAYKGEEVSEEGDWDEILDAELWRVLDARLERTRRPGRPSTSLLAGIARCGLCGGPLWSTYRRNRAGERVERYACIRRPGTPGCGKIGVVGDPLDALVTETVIAALAGPKLTRARRRTRSRKRTGGQDHAKALARAEQHLEQLAVDHARDRITRREWLAARDDLHAQIAEHTRALDTDTGPLASLPGTQKALRDAWEAGTVEWRRAVLAAAVDAVVVNPAGPSRTFDPERVEIRWRA
jgi:DNA invertase Pin-like site-specific DNA recombinase